MCKVRQCLKEESVPLVLRCAGCAPWTAVKGWATLNILFCRKSELGVGRPVITKIRLALEQYLGKISIPNDKLSVAANLIITHSLDLKELSLPVYTPPATSQSLVLGLTLPLLLLYQKYQSVHLTLCNG